MQSYLSNVLLKVSLHFQSKMRGWPLSITFLKWKERKVILSCQKLYLKCLKCLKFQMFKHDLLQWNKTIIFNMVFTWIFSKWSCETSLQFHWKLFNNVCWFFSIKICFLKCFFQTEICIFLFPNLLMNFANEKNVFAPTGQKICLDKPEYLLQREL